MKSRRTDHAEPSGRPDEGASFAPRKRMIRHTHTLRDARADAPDSIGQVVMDALFDPSFEAEIIKRGDRTTLYRAVVDGQSYVIKRYNRRGWLHTATHLVLRSRARWSWMNARRLHDLGLRTPQPHIMVEERAGGMRLRSAIVTDWVEGPTLLAWVGANRADLEAIRRIALEFATIWEAMGAHCISHGDMKATNFIVDRQSRLWIVDLDAMRRHIGAAQLSFHRARRKDRWRFLRNWQEMPEVQAIFRDQIDRR